MNDRPDLSAFTPAPRAGRAADWAERRKRIAEHWPSVDLDARHWITDDDAFIAAMRDVIKYGVRDPAKYGPVPTPTPAAARAEWARLAGNPRPPAPPPPAPAKAPPIPDQFTAPVFLTSAQAAAYLGVPRRTLLGWHARGVGPPFTWVRTYRYYRPADLDAFRAGRR